MNGCLTRQPGSPIRQLTVTLDNRTGALSSLLSLLASHGIICLGCSTADFYEATVVRLILSDPDFAITLFLERGIGFIVSEILVIAMRGGAQDLGDCLDILFQAEINVDFIYPLFPSYHGVALAAFHVKDPAHVRSILNARNICVYYQEDLSR